MKKIFNLLIFVVLLGACERVGYEVRGKLTGLPEGAIVYVEDVYSSGKDRDTVVMQGNQFVLKKTEKLEVPRYCQLVVRMGIINTRVTSFWVDNGVTEIKQFVDSMPYFFNHTGDYKNTYLKAGVTQKLYDEYLNRIEETRKRYDYLCGVYGKTYFSPLQDESLDGGKRLQLVREIRNLETRLDEIGWEFVVTHGDSPVSAVIVKTMIDRNRSRYSFEKIEELYGLLCPEMSELELVKAMKEQIKKSYHHVAVGMPYYDMELVNPRGKKVKLSDYIRKGQYNFVDFWNSGCKPCRKEMPHLKYVHERCGNRLNMISVSLDEIDQNWQRAMEEEKMPWQQLCHADGWKGQMEKTYRLPFLPFAIIIDPEGKLEYVNLHLEELDAVLIDLGLWK